MKLHFLGAIRQVTGSQYCLEVDGAKVLIDCGLYQERELTQRNWQPSPIPPDEIDAVLLTHAHVDHCGLVPRLVRDGFRGPIMATPPSVDLAEIILRDSAKIQEEDAAYKARRHRRERRKAKYPVKPLYTARDVEKTLPLLQAVPLEQEVAISDRLSAVFHNAGHILGSATVELRVSGNGAQGRSKRFLFSGDIGQWERPLMRDPTVFSEADVVVMESTYGNREHDLPDDLDVPGQLADAINRTISAGGNVVIPTFAIERAQELMYYLSLLLRENRIPSVPVFLDSPMAADVTKVFRQHRGDFDVESWQRITSGDLPLRFPELTMVRTAEESKEINRYKEPIIIMATSGMCTAGRIKFHLRQNIKRPESTILFVGFQARGTLGRQILDGNREVRIHGRQLYVKAQIDQVRGFSGHADRSGLMRWLGALKSPPAHLFLTHGEEEAARDLAKHIQSELGWHATVPAYQDVVEID